jgi:hypothetical protein
MELEETKPAPLKTSISLPIITNNDSNKVPMIDDEEDSGLVFYDPIQEKKA